MALCNRSVRQSQTWNFKSCAIELTDHEWAAVRSMLPNKPRGAPRVDDRRFLNGIFLGVTPEHDGAICRRASALRPAITASFAGVGLAS